MPAKLLDVGCGSGRDASALAERGYDVVAVDPSKEMLKAAKHLQKSDRIQWVCDSLPHLRRVKRLNTEFALVLVSAVWMHIPPKDRSAALGTLAELLRHNGILAVSLRRGEADEHRGIF